EQLDILTAFGLFEDGPAPARVLTIDTVSPPPSAPWWKPRPHPRIEYLTGSSLDPASVARALELAADRRAMVVLDSAHAAEHVLAELRAYAPLVGPGCYLVVEDTNLNGRPVLPAYGPGPAEAV